MKKLSVIIPVYNTPKPLLEHCIASVQENAGKMGDKLEVLLINDGSTEQYIEPMLKETEASDSRFHYIYKTNSGVSDTRNMGIEMAQGEYITFVDADDYVEPDAFNYMINSTEEMGADLSVYGLCKDESQIQCKRFKKILSAEMREEVLKCIISYKYKSKYSDALAFQLHGSCGKLFKKEILDKYHLHFNTSINYAEDAFFNFCYITFIDKIYLDNKLVYHYVTNIESATKKYTETRGANTPLLLRLWENFIIKNYPDDNHFHHLLSLRALFEIRENRILYFSHPKNTKSFWLLKAEMDAYLYQPAIMKWIKELRFTDAEDTITLKNIILLKLHLYWIFLITERKKRRKQETM